VRHRKASVTAIDGPAALSPCRLGLDRDRAEYCGSTIGDIAILLQFAPDELSLRQVNNPPLAVRRVVLNSIKIGGTRNVPVSSRDAAQGEARFPQQSKGIGLFDSDLKSLVSGQRYSESKPSHAKGVIWPTISTFAAPSHLAAVKSGKATDVSGF